MERAAASMVPLRQAFDGPFLVSLAGASNNFLFWFGVPSGASLSAAPSDDNGARALRHLVPPSTISASAIPDEAKGMTYVFDVASGRYVPDAGAAGAPASGIRVVLYTWDRVLDRPILPLHRIGFADLTEAVSTPTLDLLHVRVIGDAGNGVVTEYDFSKNFGLGSVTFAIQGTVQQGPLIAGFNAQSVSGSAFPEQAHYVAIVSAPTIGVRVHTEQSISEFGDRHEERSVTYDGHTLLFTSIDSEGDVRYDGLRYATFVSTEQPDDRRTNEYVKADGTPPTPQELTGLASVLDGMTIASSFWFPLIWPFR